MRRAKLRRLKRNAAEVLSNISDAGDFDLLTQVLDELESLVREHARWALRKGSTFARRDA